MESHLLASPFPFPQTKAQSGLADLPHGASGKVGRSRPGILNFGRVSGKNKGRGEFGVFPIRRMYNVKYICHSYAKYFSPFLSIYKLQNVLEACLTCPSCCCASMASVKPPIGTWAGSRRPSSRRLQPRQLLSTVLLRVLREGRGPKRWTGRRGARLDDRSFALISAIPSTCVFGWQTGNANSPVPTEPTLSAMRPWKYVDGQTGHGTVAKEEAEQTAGKRAGKEKLGRDGGTGCTWTPRRIIKA